MFSCFVLVVVLFCKCGRQSWVTWLSAATRCGYHGSDDLIHLYRVDSWSIYFGSDKCIFFIYFWMGHHSQCSVSYTYRESVWRRRIQLEMWQCTRCLNDALLSYNWTGPSFIGAFNLINAGQLAGLTPALPGVLPGFSFTGNPVCKNEMEFYMDSSLLNQVINLCNVSICTACSSIWNAITSYDTTGF